jgi:hypothetical protein
MDWGDESHVCDVLADTGLELTFERGIAANPMARFATVDERIEHYTTVLGPLIMLRRMTEAQGRWPELRSGLAEM